MKYNYIAIEGNIGAGKSTLASKLASHYMATLVEEEFEENPLLHSFYKDPKKFAWPLELSFLLDRYRQLKKMIQPGYKTVSDFWFNKSWVFGKVNLTKEDWEPFSCVFQLLEAELPRPDLVIYYHREVGLVRTSIAERGRAFEGEIGEKYLQKIEKAYQSYLKRINEIPVLWIDGTQFAPGRNKDHFKQLLEMLEGDLRPGINRSTKPG